MAVMSTIVLVISVVGVLWFILNMRSHVRSGGIVFPFSVSATLLFSLCVVLVLLLRISALHLIWLFPVCFVVGFFILGVPIVRKIVFRFVEMLAYQKNNEV
jgi:hypothetical protein